MNNQKIELNEKIENLLAHRKGSIHTLTYRKTISLPEKDFPNIVFEAESVMQGRIGCEYENIQAVKDLHANGMGHSPLKGFTEVIKDTIYRSDKTGELALRVFPVNNGYHSKRYFINGSEVSEDKLQAMGIKEYRYKSKHSPIVCLYIKNIVSVA